MSLTISTWNVVFPFMRSFCFYSFSMKYSQELNISMSYPASMCLDGWNSLPLSWKVLFLCKNTNFVLLCMFVQKSHPLWELEDNILWPSIALNHPLPLLSDWSKPEDDAGESSFTPMELLLFMLVCCPVGWKSTDGCRRGGSGKKARPRSPSNFKVTF